MAESFFITNDGNQENNNLAHYLKNFIQESKNLDFLVGYFYFSGFQEIAEYLENQNIRILVGMDVELDFYNRVKEIEILSFQDDPSLTLERHEIKSRYLESLKKIINGSELFDNEKSQKAFEIFNEKFKNETLKIRKTKEPNHAKLYIFEKKEELNTGGLHKGNVITGSSNLTLSGLKARNEVNAAFYNQHFKEAQALFNRLWHESVEVPYEDYIKQVEKKVWIGKLPKPILLYIKTLKEMFSRPEEKIANPSRITRGRYQDFSYQIDAVAEGIEILDRHNGVIIADVVGLGKSIIASAIAHNLNLPTLIIAPPHLKTQWEDNYRYEFDLNATVFSSGKLEDPLNALSRMSHEGQKLIIIDEAHKFRNEETRDYDLLQKICQGNKVMLLTATPFSNRPHDVFSMIKLFQIPNKSTLQYAGNLSEEFRRLIKEYEELKKIQKKSEGSVKNKEKIKSKIQALATEIRKILEPLVIRRSRLDLMENPRYKKDLENQKIKFPEVAPPVLLEYDLENIAEIYLETLEMISSEQSEDSFQAVRYKPYRYIKAEFQKELAKEFGDQRFLEESQDNLAKFMRFLLVRRLESSIEAFRISVKKMIGAYDKTISWYEKLNCIPIWKEGRIPEAETLLDFDSDEDDSKELDELTLDSEQENPMELLKAKGLKTIPASHFTPDFIEQVKKDREILLKIQANWKREKIKEDPKYNCFFKLLNRELKSNPQRKIIVFSEFADTAEAIYQRLQKEKNLRPFLYTSAHATKKNKETIQKNFDAGILLDEQENDYDVLIATDAISEGYNLHRAGIVINYDIPYNPTRVIQRIGRINRINKKMFDRLFIYHFFPTAIGERVAGIHRISTFKMHLIQALVGEDTQILTHQEEISAFFKQRMEREIAKMEGEKSWKTPYEAELYYYEQNHPQLMQEVNALPNKVRIGRNKAGIHQEPATLLFARKGKETIFKYCPHFSLDTQILSSAQGLALMKASLDEAPFEVSPQFEPLYQNLKKSLKDLSKPQHQAAGGKDPVNRARNNLTRLSLLSGHDQAYLDMVREVLNYDALSAYLLKKIINAETIEELKKEATPDFLEKLLKQARMASRTPDLVILAEDLKGEA